MNGLIQSAWEPITPRGVAAFARAPIARLWVVQLFVALLVAGSVVWLLYGGVFPTIRKAIRQLPDAGDIRSAKLDWRGVSPILLAEGNIVAFSVDLNHSGDIRSPAHFQVEFGREDLVIHSLLGYLDRRYPTRSLLAFNRPELEPKWGAWEVPILGIAVLVTLVGLFIAWSVLATLYALPVWLIALFSNRDLRLAESWRLAGAALMPGAVIMAIAIVLYGLGVLDLVALTVVGVGHVVVGWVYLFVSQAFLVRAEAASGAKNPFVDPKA